MNEVFRMGITVTINYVEIHHSRKLVHRQMKPKAIIIRLSPRAMSIAKSQYPTIQKSPAQESFEAMPRRQIERLDDQKWIR